MNAAAGDERTDCWVQTYDSHLKATHQRAAIGLKRPVASIAPDSLAHAEASAGGAGELVAVAFKQTTMPALDGAARVAAFATPDAQHRIGIGKVTGRLGWDGDTDLVAVCELGRVTVTAAALTRPAQAPVTLDGKGRLRLHPTAAAVLRLDPAKQVLAIAVPGTGELVLMAAETALAQLTGPVTITAPVPAHEEPETMDGLEAQPQRTNVRGRFEPSEGAA